MKYNNNNTTEILQQTGEHEKLSEFIKTETDYQLPQQENQFTPLASRDRTMHKQTQDFIEYFQLQLFDVAEDTPMNGNCID